MYRKIIYCCFSRKQKKYNYKMKTSPEMPKAQANKTGVNFMILYFCIRRKLEYNMKEHIIFQYSLEPVLIQRILIGFKAILEKKIFKLSK